MQKAKAEWAKKTAPPVSGGRFYSLFFFLFVFWSIRFWRWEGADLWAWGSGIWVLGGKNEPTLYRRTGRVERLRAPRRGWIWKGMDG